MTGRRKLKVIIGLTGSIGMGKSTTASMLKKLNFEVFKADQEAHLLLNHPDIQEKILTFFPSVLENGKINRSRLGEIVFGDMRKLKVLEKILHPEVRQSALRFLETHQNAPYLCLDVPLLFEEEYEKLCTHVVCVWCDPHLRAQRLLTSRGLTQIQLDKILQHQMEDKKRMEKSDFILNTGEGKVKTFQQLRDILLSLCTEELDVK